MNYAENSSCFLLLLFSSITLLRFWSDFLSMEAVIVNKLIDPGRMLKLISSLTSGPADATSVCRISSNLLDPAVFPIGNYVTVAFFVTMIMMLRNAAKNLQDGFQALWVKSKYEIGTFCGFSVTLILGFSWHYIITNDLVSLFSVVEEELSPVNLTLMFTRLFFIVGSIILGITCKTKPGILAGLGLLIYAVICEICLGNGIGKEFIDISPKGLLYGVTGFSAGIVMAVLKRRGKTMLCTSYLFIFICFFLYLRLFAYSFSSMDSIVNRELTNDNFPFIKMEKCAVLILLTLLTNKNLMSFVMTGAGEKLKYFTKLVCCLLFADVAVTLFCNNVISCNLEKGVNLFVVTGIGLSFSLLSPRSIVSLFKHEVSSS